MSPFDWIAIAVVTITSSSRITRLLTFDRLPPIFWARRKYLDFTDAHAPGWGLVAFCGYCMSFWVTLAIVMWGWASNFDTAWWLVNAIFGGSYLAAILMANDGDDSGEDD